MQRRCTGFREKVFIAVPDSARTDNSPALLRELALIEPRLRVIRAPAINRTEDATRFFALLQQGYDCIFSSRFMPGGRMSDASAKRYLMTSGCTHGSNCGGRTGCGKRGGCRKRGSPIESGASLAELRTNEPSASGAGGDHHPPSSIRRCWRKPGGT